MKTIRVTFSSNEAKVLKHYAEKKATTPADLIKKIILEKIGK